MNFSPEKYSGLLFAGLVAATAVVSPSSAHAEEYDMDCKVILCLAGGFPPACSDAFSYMMRRLTRVPPKPPFGFCAMGDLDEIDFPDNEDPAALEAMIDVIDDPDTARTLRSVRAEVARGHSTCQNNPDGDSWKCTDMIELNGDGSNLFMGSRGSVHSPFWRRGNRVLFVDHEGIGRSIGNAEHYNVTGRQCVYEGGQMQYCYSTYSWQRIASQSGAQ